MLKIAFLLLGISVCIFAWIMLCEPRTLWSGVSLLGVLLCSAVTMFFLLSEYADWLAERDPLMNILVALFLAKQQGLKCVGFGARTKWYFTLNALIREFVGYLGLTWKQHVVVAALIFMISVFAV